MSHATTPSHQHPSCPSPTTSNQTFNRDQGSGIHTRKSRSLSARLSGPMSCMGPARAPPPAHCHWSLVLSAHCGGFCCCCYCRLVGKAGQLDGAGKQALSTLLSGCWLGWTRGSADISAWLCAFVNSAVCCCPGDGNGAGW